MRSTATKFLTVKQAAGLLRVSDRTVRRWLAEGSLISHRLGRCRRIAQDDLDKFLRQRREASYQDI